MYSSTNELIKNELHNGVIKPVYNIFEDSIIVYSELMSEKKELFNGAYLTEFKGRLLSFIIKRYFDKDRIPKNFPFEVNAVKMAFGQKRTELTRNNIRLTLAKAQESNALPTSSGYKTDYARGNSLIDKQMIINMDGYGEKFRDMPYYGILAYKVKDNSLEFLNIIIPDSAYKRVLDVIPLTPSLKLVHKIDKEEDDDERFFGREHIKKEILQSITQNDLERGSSS